MCLEERMCVVESGCGEEDGGLRMKVMVQEWISTTQEHAIRESDLVRNKYKDKYLRRSSNRLYSC